MDREELGREVRRIWIEWAREQEAPKPSWLVPWEELAEPDREVDRRIGEHLYALGQQAHTRRREFVEERERKAEAWDALTALLPLTGEWHRGAVLAERGDLLPWVMKNDPRHTGE